MANLEVIALDTVTPQLKAPQAGDGYAMPRPVTVTEVVGSTALTLTGATQTTAVPVFDATQTWNNAAVTFTGLKFNATDTASNAASLLMDLQVGGTSKFKVEKSGRLYFQNNASFYIDSTIFAGYQIFSFTAGASTFTVRPDQGIFSNQGYGFCVGTSAPDAYLFRDAADTLAQRRTTNAQSFRVYKTYTDASNYERGVFDWSTTANILTIGTQKAGTGVERTVQLTSAASTYITFASSFEIRIIEGTTNRWRFASTVFRPEANNTNDIGLTGTRIRTLFAGTSVEAPILRTDTAYTVATLPAAGTAGRRAYVIDALAPTFLGAMTGGGAVICPVFDNGTAWVAG